MPELVEPSSRWQASFAEALYEGLDLTPATPEDILLARHDFDEYMRQRHDLSRPIVLPGGITLNRVPQHDYWLVEGDRFLGRISLRPTLNSYLKKRGGNIGYAVRRTERRKGYGRLMLDLMLPLARAKGLEKVLVTCHDENTGSIKIIEGAGGVLQDKVLIDGQPLPERRYWIDLTGVES